MESYFYPISKLFNKIGIFLGVFIWVVLYYSNDTNLFYVSNCINGANYLGVGDAEIYI